MKKIYSFLFKLTLIYIPSGLISQTMPVSLRSDISVQFVMNVYEKSDRVAKDPISNNLFYITAIGNVYEIKNLSSTPYYTLVYTAADHGIDFLQGMAFLDSSLFLIGNHLIDSTLMVGIIKKAVLQPSGSRAWVNVATTQAYAQSWTWYDHGFSGIVVSPDSNYIYFSSGSRTDHGEEQNNYGMYPGMREVPLTSAIFRIPANSVNLFLQNDATALAPYLFADGTRNSFDLAFDPNDNLFATENSGDRDDPDEFNWIRQGKNYGFPWIMGGNNNPQQYPGYVPANDALLNHNCNCAQKGYYYNDPAFPDPTGLTFSPPVKNLGPDADKYRENSGQVKDGSTTGNNINSFTPHRCPLGLSFDKKKLLAPGLQGDGFMVSFTRGGDSTGLDMYGYPGTICDPGQDLLHLELTPDGSGEYQMQATIIVNNFSYPVDTYLDGNILYVIEYSYSGDGRLFKVTLPLAPAGIQEENKLEETFLYPNPVQNNMTVSNAVNKIEIYDVNGSLQIRSTQSVIDISKLAPGMYVARAETENGVITKKFVKE